MSHKALSPFFAALIFLAMPAPGWAFIDFFSKDRENAPEGEDMQRQDGLARAMVDEATGLEGTNPDKARNIYRNVVKKYPLTPTAGLAQYKVGVLFRSEGKHVKAFGAFQEFVENYKRSAAFASAVQAQYEIARDGQEGAVKDKFLGITRKIQPSELLDMYGKIIKNAPYSEYAPLAQFAIGEVYQEDGKATEAIAAYQKMVDDYPRSPKAAEAQLRIGAIGENMLDRGNQDPAKVDAARLAYEDLLIQFPDHALAEQARAGISKLDIGSAAKAYGVGRFYEKQGRYSSARIYYEQVVATPDSEYASKAAERLAGLPESQPDTASNAPYFSDTPEERKGFGLPRMPKLFGKKDADEVSADTGATGDGDLFPGAAPGEVSDSEWAELDRDMRGRAADSPPETEGERKGLRRLAFWKKDADQAVDSDASFAGPVDGDEAEKKPFLRMPKLLGGGKDNDSDAVAAVGKPAAPLAPGGAPAPVAKVKNQPNYVGPPAPKKQTSAVAMRLNQKDVPLMDEDVFGLSAEPLPEALDALGEAAEEIAEELLAPAPPEEVDDNS